MFIYFIFYGGAKTYIFNRKKTTKKQKQEFGEQFLIYFWFSNVNPGSEMHICPLSLLIQWS